MGTLWKQTVLAITTLVVSATICRSADTLKWNAAADRVDANIEAWSVPELLQNVATATGWQIFIDPQITNRIPAKFSGKQPGDALRQLLGDYNYALVPETNGPARLFVPKAVRHSG